MSGGITEKMFTDLRDQRHKFSEADYGLIEAFKEALFRAFIKEALEEIHTSNPKPPTNIAVTIDTINIPGEPSDGTGRRVQLAEAGDDDVRAFIISTPLGELPCM